MKFSAKKLEAIHKASSLICEALQLIEPFEKQIESEYKRLELPSDLEMDLSASVSLWENLYAIHEQHKQSISESQKEQP